MLTKGQINKGYREGACPKCGTVFKQKYLVEILRCRSIFKKGKTLYRCNYNRP